MTYIIYVIFSKRRAARLGTAARGGNIHQAAGKGDVPALRHFLRVAPGKVHEKDDEIGPGPQKNCRFFFCDSGGGSWVRRQQFQHSQVWC